jgi:hypothetical protein
MAIKSFKQFLSEADNLNWVKSGFQSFKSQFETKVKETTQQPFEVIPTKHYFDQVLMRTGDDPKFRGNIFITEAEMSNIYNKIINKFFVNENGNGGIIKVKSPTNFKVKTGSLVGNRDNTQSGEWEFQHKITMPDNAPHYRCAVYVVAFIAKKENGKDVIINKSQMRLITMMPSDKDGKDDFKDTTGLTESIDFDTINYIED